MAQNSYLASRRRPFHRFLKRISFIVTGVSNRQRTQEVSFWNLFLLEFRIFPINVNRSGPNVM